MLIQAKEAIIGLKKQNKPNRENNNFRGGHINTLVHSQKQGMYWPNILEDDRRQLKQLHNI